MTKDLFGTNRLKINLHTHTTLSDGAKTPKEVAEIYKKSGKFHYFVAIMP